MKTLMFKLILTITVLFTFVSVYAIKATPDPIKVLQPDGSKLTILLMGDEFFKYRTTFDGFLIEKNDDGFYHYASFDTEGKIIVSQVRTNELNRRNSLEKSFLENLTPFPDASEFNVLRRIQKAAEVEKSFMVSSGFPLTGSARSLVILVNFSDVSFSVNKPQEAFANLLNQPNYSANGGTGSARDYFISASNGVFSPQFDVIGPFTLPNNVAYYGGNDTSGNDQRPRQMVADACALADAAGIDFSVYDTDNNGYVDNIFIYYAGHNEAEGAKETTVWSHRWVVSNANVIFDGVRIYDYACTSELRGSSGTNMCGIGTFCHEFGHVLGLPDYYATNGATHHTLYNWNIMDNGAYLNLGRTPPTYSAYDRFYLGWLKPEELFQPKNSSLGALVDTNKAYLISQNGNHNLNGQNPNPVEFFTLENRQKTGWDTYLPNSGLLITRIYYNATTWSSNTVNNISKSMGVDIVEADGVASVSSAAGDVFPGTGNVTTYNPNLRNGTMLPFSVSNILQYGDIISFKFNNIDIDLSPIMVYLSNNVINENSPLGSFIGKLSTEDPEIDDKFIYSLISGEGSTDNNSFTISNDSLFLNTSLDYKTKKSYTIRIRSTDLKGLFMEMIFVINVKNIFNEKPTMITLSNNSINENKIIGSIIGTLTTTDLDFNDSFTYALVPGEGSEDNDSLLITLNQLIINSALNHEAKNKLYVRIRTTDLGGLFFEKAFIIDVLDVNEAPTNIELKFQFTENIISKGTTVCELITIDEDKDDIFKYSLVTGNGSFDNNLFGLLDNNKLIALERIDLTNNNKYYFRIQTKDKGGLTFQNYFTLSSQDMYNSLNEFEKPKISFHPNPASNCITLNGLESDSEITISNLLGQTLLMQSVSPNEIVNIFKLSKGIYLLSVTSNNKEVVMKVVKN